jgi:F-type H+-transporting ATPase subunit b
LKRWGCWIVLAVVGWVAPIAPTALGADAPATKGAHAHDAHDAHDHDAHAGHDEHGHGHGHPDPKVYGKPPAGIFGKGTEFLSISPELLIWTVVVFLVLSFVLRRFAWKPILSSMEDREHRITKSLEAAHAAREETKDLLAQQDVQLAAAHEEIKRMVEQARNESSKESEALIAKAREDAARAREAAQREIEEARVAALAEVRGSASRIAADMAGKTVGKRFSPEQVARSAGEALS